jgi:hypothetical protein
MNIDTEKALIIEQVKLVNDTDLIKAIKSLLDYGTKRGNEKYEIPEAQQNLVMERFEDTRKNPEKLLDWDEARKTL